MANMQDIAKRAGVSRASVSFVLNKRERPDGTISELTQARIVKAAEELGYHRNGLARAVVTGKSRVLGFITAQPGGTLSGQMLTGAVDEARKQNYFVKIVHLKNTHDVDTDTLEQCLEMRLSGALVLYSHGKAFDYFRREMSRYGAPVALLDDNEPQSHGLHLLTDYALGMAQAVDHLVELGHRQITYLGGGSGSIEDYGNNLREAAFLQALEKQGLPITAHSAVHATNLAEAKMTDVEHSVKTLLSGNAPPTAFVCVTDNAAMATLRAIRAMGFFVPRDVSVVGFAGEPLAELADPALTTVAQPFYAIGETGTRDLISKIEQTKLYSLSEDAGCTKALPTHLIVRDSTGPVRSCSLFQ